MTRPLQLLALVAGLAVVTFLIASATNAFTTRPGESTAQADSLIALFGTSLRARPGTDLAIIQAVVIGTLAPLIWLTARLAHKDYIYRWAGVWVALFVAYSYRALAGIPSLGIPYEAPALLRAASVSSTVFMLLTWLRLVGWTRRMQDDVMASITATVAMCVVAVLYMTSGRITSANAFAATDAAAGAIVTALAGIALTRRARGFRGVPGGVEILPAFLAYAALQLAGPLVETAPWSGALFVAALALKVPCSLAVVAIALRDVWRETAATAAAHRAAAAEAEEARSELATALAAADETHTRERVRATALEELDAQLISTQTVAEAIDRVLPALLNITAGRRALVYMSCPTEDGVREHYALTNYFGVTAEIGLRKIETTPGLDQDGSALTQHVAATIGARAWNRPPQCWPLPCPDERSGWLVLDGAGGGPTAVTMQEAVGRVAAGLEIAFLREQLTTVHEIRRLMRSSGRIRLQLEAMARLTARQLNARRVTIDVTDGRSGIRYYAAWPPVRDGGEPPPTPYPGVVRADWLPPARPGGADRDIRTTLRIPIRAIDESIKGVVYYEGKLDTSSVALPFTALDCSRVEVVKDMIGVAIDRAERERSMELFLVRSVHELRNPVGSLMNITRWMGKTLRPEPKSKLQKKLQDATMDIDTLSRLVDKVDLYRRGAAEMPIRTRIFGSVVMKAADDLKRRLRDRGVPEGHIVVQIRDVSVVPALVVRTSEVQQILLNVIENAFKYRDPQRVPFRMEFVGDQEAHYYLIRIRDWGIGVPEDWEERIFRDGERAPNAVAHSVTGMGMGLAIARELAERMGGYLRLTRRGHPTEFVFGLPKELAE